MKDLPDLPRFLDGSTVSVSVEAGHRGIAWTLLAPGVLYGCRFAMWWISITETAPFQGEPGPVLAVRRPRSERDRREVFPAATTARIAQALRPPLARYGFARYWHDLHRRQPVGDVDRLIAELDARKAWHSARHQVAEMYRDGVLDVMPLRRPPGLRPARVAAPVGHHGAMESTEPLAELRLAGEQVGWLTDTGDIVPLTTQETTS